MGLSVVTWPEEAEILKILSVEELKANLRITHVYEDQIARDCILAAYDWFANPETGWLRRAVLTATYKMSLPGFQRQEVYSSSVTGGPATRWVATPVIELPRPPLQSIASVKYLSSGSQVTLSPSSYTVTTDGFGKLYLAAGSTWPTGVDTNPGAVEVEFVAGYGDAEDVKKRARGVVQAMKLLASDSFRNREDTYVEPRAVEVNRRIINGIVRYAGRYQIKNDHA